jgi:hypothetical protein
MVRIIRVRASEGPGGARIVLLRAEQHHGHPVTSLERKCYGIQTRLQWRRSAERQVPARAGTGLTTCANAPHGPSAGLAALGSLAIYCPMAMDVQSGGNDK